MTRPGPGRPRLHKPASRTSLQVYLDIDLDAQLRAFAAERGESLSSVTADALTCYLRKPPHKQA